MQEFLIFLKERLSDHPVFYFILLQTLGGRAFAVITAKLVGFNMFYYVPLAMCVDMVQVPFFFYLYNSTTSRIPFLEKVRERISMKKNPSSPSFFLRIGQKLGVLGVPTICLMPIKGGGIWTSVLLAHMLELGYLKSCLLLLLGSFAGAMLLVEAAVIIKAIGSLWL